MKKLRNYLAITILTFSVAACNGGGGGGGGGGGNTLSFDLSNVNIHLDDTNDLILTLKATQPNQTINANISSSDPNVAVLTPKCTLSNQEGATNDCKVTLKGNALGKAIITASAAGTSSASATANVSTNIEPGYLEFTPNPIDIITGNTNTITLSLVHSSGVKNQGVTITEADGFSSIAKNVSGITTCNLSSPSLSDPTQNECPPITVFGITPGKTSLIAKAVYGLGDKIPQATENITVLPHNIPPKSPSMKFSKGTININDTQTATLVLNGYNITSNTPVTLSALSTNGYSTNNIRFKPKCAFNKDNDLCKITVSGFVGSEGADYTITASAFGLKKAITYIDISPVGSEGSIGFSNSSENVVWGGFTPAKIQANVTNYEGNYFSLILQANNNDVILSPPPNSYNVSCSKPSLETNPSCVCSGPFNGASTSCTVYASAAVPGGKNTNTQITAIAPDGYLKPNPQEPQSTTVNIVPGQINGGMFFSAPAMNVYDKPQTISLFLLHSQKQSKFKVAFKSSNPNITVAPVGGDCELSSNNYVCQVEITAIATSGSGAIIEASAPSGLGVEPTSLAVNVNQNGYLTADPTSALMASVAGSQGVNVILTLHNYKNMPTSGIPYQVTSDNTSIATVGTPGGPITFSPSNTSPTIIINPEGLAGDTQIKLIPQPQYAAGGYPSLLVPAISMPPIQQPRNIHFVNKCSYPVWFGLDGGATAKYMSSGDCPANSTYSSSAGTCYWNAPTPPATGYELTALTGTADVTIPTSGIETQWSGTMAARTGCSNGTCDFVASCPTSGNGNLACTAGFQPPVALAEVTFATTGLDYYDISLISGISVPTSIKPTNNKGYGDNATNPYYCGTAGGITTQSLGKTTIGAATWDPQIPATIQTVMNNNPVSIPGAVFNLVSGTTVISAAHPVPNPACSAQNTCNKGLTCGYTLDAVSNGINTNPTYLLSCGTRIAYVTGDGIYKLNTTASNSAPFDFGGKDMTPGQNGNATNALGFTNADFFECPYPTLNSAYQPLTPPSGLYTCGYVDWSKLGITQADTANFITPPSPANQAWVDQVLSGIKWLKTACPSCYSYPYDDPSSTFTCHNNASTNNTANLTDYTVTFCPNNN